MPSYFFKFGSNFLILYHCHTFTGKAIINYPRFMQTTNQLSSQKMHNHRGQKLCTTPEEFFFLSSQLCFYLIWNDVKIEMNSSMLYHYSIQPDVWYFNSEYSLVICAESTRLQHKTRYYSDQSHLNGCMTSEDRNPSFVLWGVLMQDIFYLLIIFWLILFFKLKLYLF